LEFGGTHIADLRRTKKSTNQSGIEQLVRSRNSLQCGLITKTE